MKLYKRYIDIITFVSKDGCIKPLFIYWQNDSERMCYKIDKIIDIKKSASVVGGCGIRYKCIILGKTKMIYLEKDKWFVECDENVDF